jgi:hypothetical protein
MEKLGLLRAIDSLKIKGVNVVEIVTDASTSVIAHISKNNAFNGLFPTASWYQLVLKLASMLFTGRDDRFHNIFHSLDVWHKAKKLSKAISEVNFRYQIGSVNNHYVFQVAQKRGMAILGQWRQSIINHFWWCCEKSNGDHNKLKVIILWDLLKTTVMTNIEIWIGNVVWCSSSRFW